MEMKKYYEKIVKENNYRLIDFKDHLFSNINLSEDWIVISNLNNIEGKTLFLTGIGLSGVPHMGTIAQIYKAIKLSNLGYDVKVILGDIDVYVGRGERWDNVKTLSEKYRDFIIKLGYSGNINIQSKSDISTFITHAKIAKYVNTAMKDSETDILYDLEEGVSTLKQEKAYNRIYSLMFMCADFITPLLSDEYNRVVVFLGIDEHKYVKFANNILKLLSSEFEELKGKEIIGLYSPLLPGFNGHFKMSKGIPESYIGIDSSEEEIENKIMNEELDSVILEQLVNIFQVQDVENEKEELIRRILKLKNQWYES